MTASHSPPDVKCTWEMIAGTAAEKFRVNPRSLARGELETLLGPGSVYFSRQGNGRNGR